MIIGIDAGGTNVDAVALVDGTVVAREKRPKPGDRSNLQAVVEGVRAARPDTSVDRVVVATTRVMNAEVQDRLPACEALLVPGPGLAPERSFFAETNRVLEGAVDHRGRVTEAVSTDVTSEAQVTALSAKFAPRNPSLERELRDGLDRTDRRVAASHEAGAGMTYPERGAATVANAKAKPLVAEYRGDVQAILDDIGIDAPLYLLKGDGTVLGAEAATAVPADLRLSGVAASAIGLLAITGVSDAICVDIGGTTTDVARVEDDFLAMTERPGRPGEGPPYPGVRSASLPLGGDTALRETEGGVTLAGEREGPAVAFGGSTPTFADALHAAGRFTVGDVDAAKESLARFDAGADALAEELLDDYVVQVSDAIREHADEGTETLVCGGVLAPVLAEPIAAACEGIEAVQVPDLAPVAGAVGCAAARVSLAVDVRVDTDEGLATATAVGHDDVSHLASGRTFQDEGELRAYALERARAATSKAGLDPDASWSIEILDRYSVVRRRRVQGEVARIRARVPPGYDRVAGGDGA